MPSQTKSITMPESEAGQVRDLDRILALGLPELIGPDAKERIKVPPSVYKALRSIVHDMQSGQSLILVREDDDFTTQRAADFLGVSRPHLVNLLASGVIGFHWVGSHRRIRCHDLVAYAKKRNKERRKILDDLAKEAFAAGLYDNVRLPAGAEDE